MIRSLTFALTALLLLAGLLLSTARRDAWIEKRSRLRAEDPTVSVRLGDQTLRAELGTGSRLVFERRGAEVWVGRQTNGSRVALLGRSSGPAWRVRVQTRAGVLDVPPPAAQERLGLLRAKSGALFLTHEHADELAWELPRPEPSTEAAAPARQ